MYFLAVVFPPLAVLLCSKPMSAILNFFLTLFFVLPGIVHALMVVADYKSNKRHAEMVDAVKESSTSTYRLEA